MLEFKDIWKHLQIGMAFYLQMFTYGETYVIQQFHVSLTRPGGRRFHTGEAQTCGQTVGGGSTLRWHQSELIHHLL